MCIAGYCRHFSFNLDGLSAMGMKKFISSIKCISLWDLETSFLCSYIYRYIPYQHLHLCRSITYHNLHICGSIPCLSSQAKLSSCFLQRRANLKPCNLSTSLRSFGFIALMLFWRGPVASLNVIGLTIVGYGIGQRKWGNHKESPGKEVEVVWTCDEKRWTLRKEGGR